jgi:hypothetical protein
LARFSQVCHISFHLRSCVSYTLLGQFLNYTYRRTIEKLQSESDSPVAKDLPEFPLVRIRLEGTYVLVTIAALGTIGYGLSLVTQAVGDIILLAE